MIAGNRARRKKRKRDKGATSKQRMSLHFMNMCVSVRACFYLCIYKLTTAKISKFSNLSFGRKCVFLFEGKKKRRKYNFVIRAIRRYPVNHQNKFNFTLCCICARAGWVRARDVIFIFQQIKSATIVRKSANMERNEANKIKTLFILFE